MQGTFFSNFATYVEGVCGGCNQVDSDDSSNGAEKYENTTHDIRRKPSQFCGIIDTNKYLGGVQSQAIGGE